MTKLEKAYKLVQEAIKESERTNLEEAMSIVTTDIAALARKLNEKWAV